MIDPLDWVPKPLRQGDLDGPGSASLIGKSNVSPLELLIREMAQNSWDARYQELRPIFGVHLRDQTYIQKKPLQVLLQEYRNDDIRAALSDFPVHNLEIYDRNTTGLDGPVDMTPVTAGGPDNFKELIYTLGSTAHDGSTGGTYGFGKTAAYAASRIGTVIFWTRVIDRSSPSGYEHRFIVSAFSESYTHDGVQYSGRHWWGRREGDEVRPIVGDAARRLGETVFARHFHGGETGTSMLILDARFGDADSDLAEHPDDFARNAKDAILLNLWPKLVPAPQQGSTPMQILVHDGDETADLSESEHPPSMASLARGLNAIRAAQEGLPQSPPDPRVTVQEIIYTPHDRRRPIGHVALVMRLAEDASPHDVLDPAQSDEYPPHRVTLMRGLAELVVTTEDWGRFELEPGVDWIAVFKSSNETRIEKIFASLEPPAHDTWNAADGSDSGASRYYRQVKRKIVQFLDEQLNPDQPTPASDAGAIDESVLSTRLGRLLPAQDIEGLNLGSGETWGRGTSRRTGDRWRLSLLRPRVLGQNANGIRQIVSFHLDGPRDKQAKLLLEGSLVGAEGASLGLDLSDLDIRWTGVTEIGPRHALARTGAFGSVTFTSPPRRAVQLTMKAVTDDDD